jgi:hypothetical protein
MFQTAMLSGRFESFGWERIFSNADFKEGAVVSVVIGTTVPLLEDSREAAKGSRVDAVRARIATARPEEAKARAIPAP